MSKIHINKDGSLKGIPKDIKQIKSDADHETKNSHNQTSCSGKNRGDCTNAGNCSGSTNIDNCSNSGSCVVLV